MYELPTSIIIAGESWKVRNDGDFRTILDCFAVLEDNELNTMEKVIASLFIFLDGMEDVDDIQRIPDLEEAYKEMVKFFNCGQEEYPGTKHYKLIDWEQDAPLIISAVNKVAGKEVRAEKYVHWWTFMGYYVAIGECPLSNIVGIRYKKLTNKKLEKHERKFIQDNPQYFYHDNRTQEEKDFEEELRRQWNGG